MNKPKVDIGMKQEIVDFCACGCGIRENSAPSCLCIKCMANNEECIENQNEAKEMLEGGVDNAG